MVIGGKYLHIWQLNAIYHSTKKISTLKGLQELQNIHSPRCACKFVRIFLHLLLIAFGRVCLRQCVMCNCVECVSDSVCLQQCVMCNCVECVCDSVCLQQCVFVTVCHV